MNLEWKWSVFNIRSVETIAHKWSIENWPIRLRIQPFKIETAWSCLLYTPKNGICQALSTLKHFQPVKCDDLQISPGWLPPTVPGSLQAHAWCPAIYLDNDGVNYLTRCHRVAGKKMTKSQNVKNMCVGQYPRYIPIIYPLHFHWIQWQQIPIVSFLYVLGTSECQVGDPHTHGEPTWPSYISRVS